MVICIFFGGGGVGEGGYQGALWSMWNKTKISTMRRQAVTSGVQYFIMARAFWTFLSNLFFFGELLLFCFDSYLINPFYCLFSFLIHCRSFFSFTSIWTISWLVQCSSFKQSMKRKAIPMLKIRKKIARARDRASGSANCDRICTVRCKLVAQLLIIIIIIIIIVIIFVVVYTFFIYLMLCLFYYLFGC